MLKSFPYKLTGFFSGYHSPSNANEVVRYLEREAAEGSEGIENASRSNTTTPMDPRLARSVSQARSETDAYSSVKLTPASPLLPLEQLLMQQESSHDVLAGTTDFLHFYALLAFLFLYWEYIIMRSMRFRNICPHSPLSLARWICPRWDTGRWRPSPLVLAGTLLSKPSIPRGRKSSWET